MQHWISSVKQSGLQGKTSVLLCMYPNINYTVFCPCICSCFKCPNNLICCPCFYSLISQSNSATREAKLKYLQTTVLLILGTDSTCVKSKMESMFWLPKGDVKNPVPNSNSLFLCKPSEYISEVKGKAIYFSLEPCSYCLAYYPPWDELTIISIQLCTNFI